MPFLVKRKSFLAVVPVFLLIIFVFLAFQTIMQLVKIATFVLQVLFLALHGKIDILACSFFYLFLCCFRQADSGIVDR